MPSDALSALVVDLVAVNEARDARGNWIAFQNEMFVSGKTVTSTLNTISARLVALVD